MASGDILVSKITGVVNVNGELVRLKKGKTRVASDHPVVKGRKHLFEPVGVTLGIEHARRAPGEKRASARKKPAKKAAAKKAAAKKRSR